jgi:uncharacterized protein involved in exopolysaccharide biosynthesis
MNHRPLHEAMGTEPSPLQREGWVPLITAILQRRVTIARWSGGLVVIVLLVSLLMPRTYTATAAFMPQSPNASLGQLAGIAAQFGISTPTGGVGTTPDFYADLIRSGPILRAVVRHRYLLFTKGDTVAGTLVDLYKVDVPTEGWGVASAVKILRKKLDVRTDPKTSVVKLSVDADRPELAKSIVDRIMEEVSRFNLESRQSQAGQERRFIEDRVASARGELRDSENQLQAFLVRNREFRNSPQLAFEHDRLEREVGMRQQVYTSLVQAYEQARIEEVRTTPVITVVESPIVPPIPNRRYLLLKALLAVVVGFLVGGLVAVMAELFRDSEMHEPREAEELTRLWRATMGDLRAPWRLFVRGSPAEGVPPGSG